MGIAPDSSQNAEERCTERLEQRVKPSEDTRVTHLVGEDAERFFAALDRADRNEPTEVMRAAMAEYEWQVENAIR